MRNTLLITGIMFLTCISCKSNLVSSTLTEGSEPSCTSEKLKELKAQLIIAKNNTQAKIDPNERRSFEHAAVLPYERSTYTQNYFEPYFGLADDAYHQCMQKAKEAATKACAADATCSSASATMKEHSKVWTETYDETQKSCLAGSNQGNASQQDSSICNLKAIHNDPNLKGVCKSPIDGLCYNYSNRFIDHNKPVPCPDSPSDSIHKGNNSDVSSKTQSIPELEQRIKQCEASIAKKSSENSQGNAQPSKPVKQEASNNNTSNTASQTNQLDCWKDYTKIRTGGGEGICRNSSSGICYRYGSGDVKYDQGAVQCPGTASSNSQTQTSGPSSAASGEPTGSSASGSSSSMLDCNSDYSKIRAGGSGTCKNTSSGLCYKYGQNDVLYDQGAVSCR